MHTFATPEPITATVQVAGARVRVTASDRTDTVVQVEPIDGTSRSDTKVADRTKVEMTDGRLSVKTTKSGDEDGSVAITIDLPTGSNLVAYLGHSEVQARGSFGDCELHLGSGRIELDRIAALRANMSAGEVAIAHIAGRVRVDGREVAMRIDEVDGSVEVSSSSGQVSIGHASTDVELRSAGSGLDIDRADGSVTAEIGDGAIRVGRLTRGRAKLMNGRGDIEVGISQSTTARVHATSERGSVRDLVSQQENSGPFDQEVSIDARTRHGDIVVRRAEG